MPSSDTQIIQLPSHLAGTVPMWEHSESSSDFWISGTGFLLGVMGTLTFAGAVTKLSPLGLVPSSFTEGELLRATVGALLVLAGVILLLRPQRREKRSERDYEELLDSWKRQALAETLPGSQTSDDAATVILPDGDKFQVDWSMSDTVLRIKRASE